MHKNAVALIFTDKEDIYLLPYAEDDSVPMIYVVHRFDKQATQDISPVLFFISFAVLFFMFALMWFVVTRLQHQSNKLSNALQDVEQTEKKQDVSFDIQEFQRIYDDVKSAYQQRLTALQREKHYSAFLSHEIRHSLASINANIEKLDQIDGFPLDALSPMDDAKQHSLELQRIANAILALWQTARLTTTSIVVEQELSAISAQMDFGKLEIHWKISEPDYLIQCDRDLFHLLLRQLLQNARQYAKSCVSISLDGGLLTLSNDISKKHQSVGDNKEYGHQVGMYLIEKICDTMDWKLQVIDNKTDFTMTIDFLD